MSETENDQIKNTLWSLRVFFGAIQQCFIYRIFMRININVMGDSWNSQENSLYRAIVVNVFFLSEMLMIIGICYSIRKSIETAKQTESGLISDTLGRESRSEAIHHISYVSREKEREHTLIRLSQRGNGAFPEFSDEARVTSRDTTDAFFERSNEQRELYKTVVDTKSHFAMNDPKQFFESFQGTGMIQNSHRKTDVLVARNDFSGATTPLTASFEEDARLGKKDIIN